MKYNNHLNYKKRKRFLLKVRIFLLVLVMVIIAGSLMAYLKYFRTENPNTEESTTTVKTNSVVDPRTNIFKTSYFQFQASENWAQVTAESSPNKFVYRYLRYGLIEHSMTIYVNQIPSDLKPTRVLPVDIINDTSGSRFNKGDVSEHCSTVINKDKSVDNVQVVNMGGVSFTCYAPLSQYNVIVGKKGGNGNITMFRPDGSTAVYTIYYNDLRAVNSSSEISQIISTFQTR